MATVTIEISTNLIHSIGFDKKGNVGFQQCLLANVFIVIHVQNVPKDHGQVAKETEQLRIFCRAPLDESLRKFLPLSEHEVSLNNAIGRDDFSLNGPNL